MTFNQVVRGSNPRTLTKIKPRKLFPGCFCLHIFIKSESKRFAQDEKAIKKPEIHRLRKEEIYVKKLYCFDCL